MPKISRTFLLALAAALVTMAFFLGSSFTDRVESAEEAQGSRFFWVLVAAALAAPLWLPATLPVLPGRLSVSIHRVCAAALLVPLGFSGSIAMHQFELYPGALFSIATFAVTAGLSVGLVAAIVVLVLPGLKRDGRDRG